MDLGIEGKVALVTGASKGLGLGVATALANEGATVAIASRSEERIQSAAAQIGARPFVHDTARRRLRRRRWSLVCEDELGPVDILVANSGGPPASPDALSFSHDQWRQRLRAVAARRTSAGRGSAAGDARAWMGRVLSLSSSVVREPSPVLVLSAAHRAGLLAALKTIARQVAPDGVTVNTLLPGLIATDRVEELGADSPDRVATLPAGRLGTVEEFAAAGAFLCSEPAAYITATTLLVDGGAVRAV